MANKTDELQVIYARLFNEEMKKSDRRKLGILNSAIEILARDGIENVNYETVGKAAGMLRAHVQYYFKSKEALLVDLFKFVTEAGQVITIEKIQAAGDDPLARIEAILEGAYAWAESRPNDIRVQFHLMNLATHHSGFRSLHESIRRAGADRLEALVKATGLKPRKGLTAREAAFVIQSAIIGTLWMRFSLDEAPPLSRLKEIARVQIFSNFETSNLGGDTSRPGKAKVAGMDKGKRGKKR